jgi:hypothetical protein
MAGADFGRMARAAQKKRRFGPKAEARVEQGGSICVEDGLRPRNVFFNKPGTRPFPFLSSWRQHRAKW